MNFPERPPLDSYTCEKIDIELHKLDELCWPKITAMRVKSYHAPDEPVPPQQPQHLLHEIEWYADRLFKVEADYYDQFRSELHYGGWLSGLVSRVTARVMKSLETLENSDTNALHHLVGIRGGLILGYHGLVMPQVEQHLMRTLNERRSKYEQDTSNSQRGAAVHSNIKMAAAVYDSIGVDLSFAPPLVKMAHAVHLASQKNKSARAAPQRMSSSIHSPSAASKMEAYMKSKGLNQTEFAIQAGTTDKTVRKFRQTGTVKLSILGGIAKAMGTTKEEILSQ